MPSTEFESLLLTYKDIRDAVPNWPDKLVEDYLATKRDLATTADESDDRFAAIELQILLLKARLDAVELRVDQLELDIIRIEFDEVTTAISLTTTGNEIITCNNTTNITITLNATPFAGERAYITRVDGNVFIDAGSKTINGSSAIKIMSRYESRLLTYNTDIDGWLVI